MDFQRLNVCLLYVTFYFKFSKEPPSSPLKKRSQTKLPKNHHPLYSMNLHSDVKKHFDLKPVIYVMIYVFRHLDNSSDKANKQLLTNRLLCCQPEQVRNMWTL